jgi:rare lipoprotein A
MKQKFFILFLFTAVLFIKQNLYAQTQGLDTFRQEGIASWYGREFDGRPTASGEIYDSSQLTAAHPNLPFGTMLVITNKHNNKKVTVRVNDRGPFVAARIIDVSRAAAEQLDMIITGTAPVIVESVERIAVSTQAAEPGVSQPVTAQTPAAGDATPVAAQTPSATQTQAAQASAAAQTPVPANVQQPAINTSYQIKLIPDITIVQSKVYRLQVGSYKVPRNAVDAFERLKNAGLNPAYERYTDSNNGEFFRVVLAGVRGIDVQSTTERLMAIGFREAIIREEQ